MIRAWWERRQQRMREAVIEMLARQWNENTWQRAITPTQMIALGSLRAVIRYALQVGAAHGEGWLEQSEKDATGKYWYRLSDTGRVIVRVEQVRTRLGLTHQELAVSLEQMQLRALRQEVYPK